jgi:hypothetical protein
MTKAQAQQRPPGTRQSGDRGGQRAREGGKGFESKMVGEGKTAEEIRADMEKHFAYRLKECMWRLFGCCTGVREV